MNTFKTSAPVASKGAQEQPEFITHTVPDIREDAIILAVCGVPNIDEADPEDDGWFFSDFFAFNYLLRGLGTSQVWMACVHPQDLVRKHGEYLHGNPYSERKVVLSQTLLDNNGLSPVTTITTSDLLDAFLATLKTKCDQARADNHPVVVFIFGHGHDTTKGVNLGLEDHWLEIDAFRTAIGNDVVITVVSTACFSGGWSVHPQLSAMTTTAVGLQIKSESWEAPGSIGRFYGSIYATHLIQSLSDASSPLVKREEEAGRASPTGSLQPDKPDQLQAETYNDFAHTIHHTLLTRVDRFGDQHEIHFSAQDDDWEASWTGRTGIPLQAFAERWDQLVTRPSTMAPSSLNRDPTATVVTGGVSSLSLSEADPIHRGRLGSLFGGTARTQRRYVKRLAKQFLQTCPGIWTLGYGPKLHGTLQKFIKGPDKEFANTAEILRLLEYRFSMIKYAELLLAEVTVPTPTSQRCHEWLGQEWMATSSKRLNRDTKDLHHRVVQLLEDNRIFPGPTEEQGRKFYHPRDYVAAALVEVSADMQDVEQMIRNMVRRN
jgi:hypothetical protein